MAEHWKRILKNKVATNSVSKKIDNPVEIYLNKGQQGTYPKKFQLLKPFQYYIIKNLTGATMYQSKD